MEKTEELIKMSCIRFLFIISSALCLLSIFEVKCCFFFVRFELQIYCSLFYLSISEHEIWKMKESARGTMKIFQNRKYVWIKNIFLVHTSTFTKCNHRANTTSMFEWNLRLCIVKEKKPPRARQMLKKKEGRSSN